MSQLNTPNPTAAMSQVDQAMGLAYQLIQKVMPQLVQWNPKVAKELHDISRRLVSAQMDIRKDMPAFQPPPDLGMMDTAGLPPAGPLAGTGM
jgi:signal transduction histidine kinase